MIGADDLAHVLGIEPRRHRGRTDEIAEHHGELAALGGVQWARVLRRRASAAGAAGVGEPKPTVPRSPSASCADRRRLVTPMSFRSSAVSCGRTSPSILFSRNAASYCSRPRPRSHPPMSMVASALACGIMVHSEERVESVQAGRELWAGEVRKTRDWTIGADT